MYTFDDILKLLDCSVGTIDAGSIYPVAVRLSAYRSDTDWAVMVEQLLFQPQWPVHRGIRLSTDVCGNCVGRGGLTIRIFEERTCDGPEGPTFQNLGKIWSVVAPGSHSISVADQIVPITTDPAAYSAAGISLRVSGQVRPEELLRLLVLSHRDLFFASDRELRKILKKDVPLFLRLYEWHHPDKAGKHEFASHTETFRMLAQAIVSGDVNDYQPTQRPNTHWSNWPKAGKWFTNPESKEYAESGLWLLQREALKKSPYTTDGPNGPGTVPWFPPAKVIGPPLPIVPDAKLRWTKLASFVLEVDSNQFYIHDAKDDPFSPIPKIGQKEVLKGWTRNKNSIWYFTGSGEVRVDVYSAQSYEEDGTAQRVFAHNLDVKSGTLAVYGADQIHTTPISAGKFVAYCRVFNFAAQPLPGLDEEEILSGNDFERYEFVLVPGSVKRQGMIYATQPSIQG